VTSPSAIWEQNGLRLLRKAERTGGRRGGLYAWSALICFLRSHGFRMEEQKTPAQPGQPARGGLALGTAETKQRSK